MILLAVLMHCAQAIEYNVASNYEILMRIQINGKTVVKRRFDINHQYGLQFRSNKNSGASAKKESTHIRVISASDREVKLKTHIQFTKNNPSFHFTIQPYFILEPHLPVSAHYTNDTDDHVQVDMMLL